MTTPGIQRILSRVRGMLHHPYVPIMVPVVKALTFDIIGTVFDWYDGFSDQVPALAQKYGLTLDPAGFAAGAIAGYGEGVSAVSSGGPWVAPDDILRNSITGVLTAGGRTPSAAEVDDFFSIWRALPPWPDVAAGLSALHGHFTLAILSNMSVATQSQLAAHARLPFDHTLSAETMRAYKPSPAVYQMAVSTLGLQPHEILMVAAHKYDLEAAKAQGFKTAFIARPLELGPNGHPDTTSSSDFDYNVTSLTELAKALGVPIPFPIHVIGRRAEEPLQQN